MRIPSVLFLCLVLLPYAYPQVTLVRSAPDENFILDCPECTMAVADVSITQGQHALPMNLQKPVSVNLLLWRYYDKILGRDVLSRKEQIWTTCTQLLDEIPVDQLLSLHINLDWTDSSGQVQHIFLVIAGLDRAQLQQLPVESIFDPDTYSPLRFAAVAQITTNEESLKTFDCIQGNCTLEHFDPKTGSISGRFEFTANRIGMEQRGFFLHGHFER